MSKKNNLWVSKHHPKSFDELYSNPHLINYIKNISQDKNVPNLLLSGPHGSGKNALVNTLVLEYFERNSDDIRNGFLYINGALNRGKDIVTDSNEKHDYESLNVSKFTQLNLYLSVPYRLVVIDQFNEMTKEAQNALRRIMETQHDSTRFIFICPSLDNVIEAIQSRCVLLVTRKMDSDNMTQLLKYFLKKEDLESFISDQLLETIQLLVDGDIRQAINYLQTISNYLKKNPDKTVDQDELFHSVFGLPHLSLLQDIIDQLKNNEIRQVCNSFFQLYQLGYYHSEIFQLLLSVLSDKPLDELHSQQNQKIIQILVKHLTNSNDNSDSEIPLFLFTFEVSQNLFPNKN